jgi:hypothetical protein
MSVSNLHVDGAYSVNQESHMASTCCQRPGLYSMKDPLWHVYGIDRAMGISPA